MDLTTIFYHSDNFCKDYSKQFPKLSDLKSKKSKKERKYQLTLSEIMSITVYFHYSGYKTFKDYFLRSQDELRRAFPNIVSYSRIVELKQQITLPLMILAQLSNKGACTGITFFDSFPLPVCHIKREHAHKVFKGIARKGKSSMGWFYGFKVHVAINHIGEIINCTLTKGNVADNNEKVIEKITQSVTGKGFGDKGYILNSALFQKLLSNGLQVISKLRSNMKQKLMPVFDKFMLRKRGLVESVGDIIKIDLLAQHTRHRSPLAFFAHIFSSLIAYALRPKKPSIKLDSIYGFICPH
jgi:hypothetical protein